VKRVVIVAVALSACSSDLGPTDDMGPFDREVVEMCGATTSSVGVYTSGGGRMSIELHRPGCSTTGCEGSDVYASGAWATIRVAGPDLLLEGCDPVSAVGADRLRVTFAPDDGAEPETHEIGLVGECIAGPGCAATDGGP
jgi:hypothetical protein